jgi:hypothetical protein
VKTVDLEEAFTLPPQVREDADGVRTARIANPESTAADGAAALETFQHGKGCPVGLTAAKHTPEDCDAIKRKCPELGAMINALDCTAGAD